jgi:hypothetical protein
MAKKKVDPKAKQRKQAIILVSLLLGLIPIFVMFTLPALTGGGATAVAPQPAAEAQTPGAAPDTMAPPTLAGAAPAAGVAQPVAAVAGGDGIAETDPSVAASGGQLVSFDLFETKDPFMAQVGGPSAEGEPTASAPVAVDAGAAEGETAAAGGAGARTAPVVAAPRGTTGEPTAAPTAPPSATPAAAAPAAPAAPAASAAPTASTTARISVNGVAEDVTLNATFPASSSIFRLVSLAGGSAQIAIVGGAYETGAKTVKLTKSKPLTLMNMAEGTRYELVLVSVS